MITKKADMREYYENIIKIKPGLTGLWQVTGRSNVTFQDRFNIDMKYCEKHNLICDIKILLKTIAIVMNREGI